MIRLIKYFQYTRIHTSSLTFIVLSIQSTIDGNSKVRALFCFYWIQSSYYLTHSIFLMHAPSYFITLIQCSVDSVDHCREQGSKSSCLFWLNKMLYDSTHSIFSMQSINTSSLTVIIFLLYFPLFSIWDPQSYIETKVRYREQKPALSSVLYSVVKEILFTCSLLFSIRLRLLNYHTQ